MGSVEITYDEVRRLFDYDPATGKLTRKVTTSSRAQKGYVVGCKNSSGYLVVRIGKTLYYVHRLIWLWMTGSWPAMSIDHINRNASDNRWENLRDVIYSDNAHNRAVDSGVYWSHRDEVWVATISYQGARKHIGQHKDRETAERMYADYKKRYIP